MNDAQPVVSATSTSKLWSDIEAYMELHKITLEDFVRRSGIPRSILKNVRSGARVQSRSTERIQAFLDGTAIPVDKPKKEFEPDEASVKMVDEILKVASAGDRILPVVSEAIKKLGSVNSADVEIVAMNVIYAFLARIPEEQRVPHLFQIYRVAEKD